MKYINSSNWQQLSIGQKIFFSPNEYILTKIRINPDIEFWLNTNTEFACLIINMQSNEIHCLRDHFGLEPFFYSRQEDSFIFGSNLPDILNHIKKPHKLNHQQLINNLLDCSIYASIYNDHTLYSDIYRIEPGFKLVIKSRTTKKLRYWSLDENQPSIFYKNPAEYLEHFEEILNESIKAQIGESQNIATEFSGGLDSSTVLTGLYNQGYNPDIFMHIAPPNSSGVDDIKEYGIGILKEYGFNKLHHIGADEFVLEDVMNLILKLYAGNPAYFFPIGANNIHQAVSKNKNPILLSGFGGDECVSGHAPLRICLKEYLKEKQNQLAQDEIMSYFKINNLSQPSWLKKHKMLMSGMYPDLYNKICAIKQILPNYQYKKHGINLNEINSPKNLNNSVKSYEKDLLIGPSSYHLRMRVEESAILAKYYGFRYKYPLLYPKLVEFCHKLPTSQKRYNGENRIIVRDYLAKYLTSNIYQKHQKVGGIMPSTIAKIREEYVNGKYNKIFADLPYQRQLNYLNQQANQPQQIIILRKIILYCFKNYIS